MPKLILVHEDEIRSKGLEGAVKLAAPDIEIKDVVVLFPGNCLEKSATNPHPHHGEGVTLLSQKGGGGLAKVVESQYDKYPAFACLSLPNTAMDYDDYRPYLQPRAIENTAAAKAVFAVWKAIGAHRNVALPVRNYDKYFREQNKHFFSHALEGTGLEPSWGGSINKNPDLALHEFYLVNIEIMCKYFALPEAQQNRTKLYKIISDLGEHFDSSGKVIYWITAAFVREVLGAYDLGKRFAEDPANVDPETKKWFTEGARGHLAAPKEEPSPTAGPTPALAKTVVSTVSTGFGTSPALQTLPLNLIIDESVARAIEQARQKFSLSKKSIAQVINENEGTGNNRDFATIKGKIASDRVAGFEQVLKEEKDKATVGEGRANVDFLDVGVIRRILTSQPPSVEGQDVADPIAQSITITNRPIQELLSDPSFPENCTVVVAANALGQGGGALSSKRGTQEEAIFGASKIIASLPAGDEGRGPFMYPPDSSLYDMWFCSTHTETLGGKPFTAALVAAPDFRNETNEPPREEYLQTMYATYRAAYELAIKAGSKVVVGNFLGAGAFRHNPYLSIAIALVVACEYKEKRGIDTNFDEFDPTDKDHLKIHIVNNIKSLPRDKRRKLINSLPILSTPEKLALSETILNNLLQGKTPPKETAAASPEDLAVAKAATGEGFEPSPPPAGSKAPLPVTQFNPVETTPAAQPQPAHNPAAFIIDGNFESPAARVVPSDTGPEAVPRDTSVEVGGPSAEKGPSGTGAGAAGLSVNPAIQPGNPVAQFIHEQKYKHTVSSAPVQLSRLVVYHPTLPVSKMQPSLKTLGQKTLEQMLQDTNAFTPDEISEIIGYDKVIKTKVDSSDPKAPLVTVLVTPLAAQEFFPAAIPTNTQKIAALHFVDTKLRNKPTMPGEAGTQSTQQIVTAATHPIEAFKDMQILPNVKENNTDINPATLAQKIKTEILPELKAKSRPSVALPKAKVSAPTPPPVSAASPLATSPLPVPAELKPSPSPVEPGAPVKIKHEELGHEIPQEVKPAGTEEETHEIPEELYDLDSESPEGTPPETSVAPADITAKAETTAPVPLVVPPVANEGEAAIDLSEDSEEDVTRIHEKKSMPPTLPPGEDVLVLLPYPFIPTSPAAVGAPLVTGPGFKAEVQKEAELPSSLSLQINMRTKTSVDDIDNPDYQTEVKIYVPPPVQMMLDSYAYRFKGKKCKVTDESGNFREITIDKFGARELLLLMQTDRNNTLGNVDFNNYEQIDLTKEDVSFLKLLSKLCIPIGVAQANKSGGYGGSELHDVSQLIYYAALPGYQFQGIGTYGNTGEFFLIPADGTQNTAVAPASVRGFYQVVVGEPNRAGVDVCKVKPDRYVPVNINGRNYYFDQDAYKKAVAFDYVNYNLAVNDFAAKNGQNHIVSRFLSYGTGFFADELTKAGVNNIETLMTEGAVMGHRAFKEEIAKEGIALKIERFELPFQVGRGVNVPDEFKKELFMTNADALMPDVQKRMISTTNCGDPHASPGNEMSYGSVDAAIGENLVKQAKDFIPVINRNMQVVPLPEVYFTQAEKEVLFPVAPAAGAVVGTPAMTGGETKTAVPPSTVKPTVAAPDDAVKVTPAAVTKAPAPAMTGEIAAAAPAALPAHTAEAAGIAKQEQLGRALSEAKDEVITEINTPRDSLTHLKEAEEYKKSFMIKALNKIKITSVSRFFFKTTALVDLDNTALNKEFIDKFKSAGEGVGRNVLDDIEIEYAASLGRAIRKADEARLQAALNPAPLIQPAVPTETKVKVEAPKEKAAAEVTVSPAPARPPSTAVAPAPEVAATTETTAAEAAKLDREFEELKAEADLTVPPKEMTAEEEQLEDEEKTVGAVTAAAEEHRDLIAERLGKGLAQKLEPGEKNAIQQACAYCQGALLRHPEIVRKHTFKQILHIMKKQTLLRLDVIKESDDHKVLKTAAGKVQSENDIELLFMGKFPEELDNLNKMCDDSILALQNKFFETLKQEKRNFLEEKFFRIGKRIITESIRANPDSPLSWNYLHNYLIRSALKEYGFDTLLYGERQVSVLKDLNDPNFMKANFSDPRINDYMHQVYKTLFGERVVEKSGLTLGEGLMNSLEVAYNAEISSLKKVTADRHTKTEVLPSTHKPPGEPHIEPPPGHAPH